MTVAISSASRKYGQVKMFDAHKLFGFVRVEGSTLEVFIHLTARLSYSGDNRYPKKDDWISFEMLSSPRGLKGVAWQLEPDYIAPAIVSGTRQHFDVSQIPEIFQNQIQEHDEIVGTIARDSSSSREWFEIVYRPSARKLFKIACWDSGTSSFQTALVGADLADVTFGNKNA